MAGDQYLPSLALLAGGLATRLYPITEKIPKSMLLIAGEPFIAHQLRQIRAKGVRKVVLCVGYLGEQVRDFVGNGAAFGLEVDYSQDGDVRLGTGGALKKALPKLGDAFLVMYGDSYLPTAFAPVADFFRASQRQALMTVYHNAGLWDQSNVVFKDGQILAYDKNNKTPEMTHIDYGLGAFRASAFDAYADNVVLDLADVYRDLLSARQLAGYEVRERFYEIGSFAGMRETDTFLKNRRGL
ncbi:MAG: sugar phosphate nucleotidyltransferase [Alphaproteobacteria bacterium]|nr:sugar phosphate nucleotidyltransferase [Alphaproteobacteria bacterium]